MRLQKSWDWSDADGVAGKHTWRKLHGGPEQSGVRGGTSSPRSCLRGGTDADHVDVHIASRGCWAVRVERAA